MTKKGKENLIVGLVVGAVVGALGYKYYQESNQATSGLGQWEPSWWIAQQRQLRPYARNLRGFHRVQAADRYTPSPVWPRVYN